MCGFKNWGELSLYDRYLAVRSFIIASYWSVMLLLMRIWVGMEFFLSGKGKLDDWDTTLMLFQYEYNVPFLSPEFAAKMAACTELSMPIFLFMGLFSRLATVPLLGMALVIQFILGVGLFKESGSPFYDNIDHFLWMAVLMTIFIKGAGKISLDYLLQQAFKWKFSSKE